MNSESTPQIRSKTQHAISLLIGALVLILALAIELPTQPGKPSTIMRAALIGAALLAFLLSPLIRKVTSDEFRNRTIRVLLKAGLLLPAAAVLGALILGSSLPFWLTVLLLVLTVLTFSFCRAYARYFAEGGILCLFLSIGLIVSTELMLKTVPTRYLKTDASTTPPLLDWIDRGEQVFIKNGFRGRRPCIDCTDRPLRIFTMGGSSTYGIPMYYTMTTYAAVLERLLHERRPGERFEVLNAGIPGFGVIQILDAINRTVLPYKPDIITVNAWFNDKSKGFGWYGGTGQSDLDGYMRMRFLRWLQDWPPYRAIHNTRNYAWVRLILIDAKHGVMPYMKFGKLFGMKKASRLTLRSTPEEYREGLKRIVALGRKHDFLPVFLLEPQNRPRPFAESIEKNPYQRAMVEVAREEGVPLVDTLSPLHARQDDWLFYDIIHPNEKTHRLIADAIYDDLFAAGGQTDWGQRFFRSRGIQTDVPKVMRAPEFQFDRDELAGTELCAELRAPFADKSVVSASISLDGVNVFGPFPVTATPSRVKFMIPPGKYPPIVDLSVRARHETPFTENAGAKLSARIPFHLELASGWTGKRSSFIKVKEVRSDTKSGGFDVVIIGAESGTVKAIGGFTPAKSPEDSRKLLEFLENSAVHAEGGVAPYVAIVLGGEGSEQLDQTEFKRALVALGGRDVIPKKDEAFLFLGQKGAPKESALQLIGGPFQEAEIGTGHWSASELLEVRSFGKCPSAPAQIQ